MDIKYYVDKNDISSVKDIVNKKSDDEYVKQRIKNISKPIITQDRFWESIILGLLTSQQKSSPNSPVKKLLNDRPFLLSFGLLNENENQLDKYIKEVLGKYKGIRYYNNIRKYILSNRKYTQYNWDTIEKELKNVILSKDENRKEIERKICRYLQEYYFGIGPKQSRNAMQELGIIKYEIPIDSRMTKWISKNLIIDLPLNSTVLSSSKYYEYYLDRVQQICESACILPTIFDACVFVTFNSL
jgi:hypothetical protein